MKALLKQYFTFSCVFLLILSVSSCKKFLDKIPESQIIPEKYFNSDQDLDAYALGGYNFPGFPDWGFFSGDDNSDVYSFQRNGDNNPNTWFPGQRRVSSGYGNWSFGRIRSANYFLEQVLPKVRSNSIKGDANKISHYIGEVYFNRAQEYFDKLMRFGDFPIIKNTLSNGDNQALIDANKRMPRNQVARFILADLDTAISLLNLTDKNRINKQVALLFKSRVALFEATWEGNFKGTAFIPGGQGWPGAILNPGFNINITQEIDFFLTQAMDAAKQVADNVSLTENSHVMNPPLLASGAGWNPYYEMFSSNDMNGYREILMWKDYARGLVTHTWPGQMFWGPAGGAYKQHIDSYLMQNGLPKYAPGSGFDLDSTIQLEKANRDERLQLFISGEYDVRYVNVKPNDIITYPAYAPATGGGFWGYPPITHGSNQYAFTGYMPRKYFPYQDIINFGNGAGETGYPLFRAAETYLNYIEASYLKEGKINSTAASYWRALRRRAGVDEDFQKTIANTDLTKEEDLAKYSGGQMVDATMYNIRRERSCEFFIEGFRWMDLKRWRALDNVKNYEPKGFNLWDNAYKHYPAPNSIMEATGTSSGNVSNKSEGKYLRPFRKDPNNLLYKGFAWTMAYYLEPIGYQAFLITSNISAKLDNVVYQNPYWPIEPNGMAIQ